MNIRVPHRFTVSLALPANIHPNPERKKSHVEENVHMPKEASMCCNVCIPGYITMHVWLLLNVLTASFCANVHVHPHPGPKVVTHGKSWAG